MADNKTDPKEKRKGEKFFKALDEYTSSVTTPSQQYGKIKARVYTHPSNETKANKRDMVIRRLQRLNEKIEEEKEKIDQFITANPTAGDLDDTRLEALRKERDKLNETKQIINRGNQFGTIRWEEVEYETTNEITTDRFTVVNIFPEVRVFICGVEITKVLDVNCKIVSHEQKVSPSTCRIRLMNNDLRYRVSYENLSGVWQEYDDEKRFIFNLKQMSYRPVYEGQTCFSINDPVVVFMKDRFLPFWRFAFSGFINNIDDSEAPENQGITLMCEDVTKFVRMKQYNINPGVIEPGMIRSMATSKEQKSSALKSMCSGKNCLDSINSVFFGPEGQKAMKFSKDGYVYESISSPDNNYALEDISIDEIPPISFKPLGDLVLESDEATTKLVKEELRQIGNQLEANQKEIEEKQRELATNPESAESIHSEIATLKEEKKSLEESEMLLQKDLPIEERGYSSKKFDRKLERIKRTQKEEEEKRDVGSGMNSNSNTLKSTNKFTFSFDFMEKQLEKEYLDPGPLASLIMMNIGFFREYRHIFKGSTSHTFSKAINPKELTKFYDQIPRWFITNIVWTGEEYEFSFMGCQGINPLLTSSFVDGFNVTPKLIESIENSKTKNFLVGSSKTEDKSQFDIPYPYDLVKMNTLGCQHTVHVRNQSPTASFHVNPRLFVVLPEILTEEPSKGGGAVFPIEFGKFPLISSEYESAAQILERILSQTDLISWVSPMGDFIIEPRYYDTNPWDWNTRGPGHEKDLGKVVQSAQDIMEAGFSNENFKQIDEDINPRIAVLKDERKQKQDYLNDIRRKEQEFQPGDPLIDDSFVSQYEQDVENINIELASLENQKAGLNNNKLPQPGVHYVDYFEPLSAVEPENSDSTSDENPPPYIPRQQKKTKIYSWSFVTNNSFLDSMIELKDETISNTIINSEAFVSQIEVFGSIESQFGILDQEVIGTLRDVENQGGGKKMTIPSNRLVADGLDPDLSFGGDQEKRKEVNTRLTEIRQKLRTLGGIQELIEQNVYDPTTDFVRTIGYKTFKTQGNILILTTHRACVEFSKILFNRFLGEAFSLKDTTIFGRPGILPNRPLYIRSKNIIVTPKSLQLSIKVGSSYDTRIDAGYLRSQSFMGLYAFSPKTGLQQRVDSLKEQDDEYKPSEKLSRKERKESRKSLLAEGYSEEEIEKFEKEGRKQRRQSLLKSTFANKNWSFKTGHTNYNKDSVFSFFPQLQVINWNEVTRDFKKTKENLRKLNEENKADKEDEVANKTNRVNDAKEKSLSDTIQGAKQTLGPG